MSFESSELKKRKMATKGCLLSLKNRQDAFNDSSNGQYNNLNLNQNHHLKESFESKMTSNDSKKEEIQNYAKDLQPKKFLNLWNKSTKDSSANMIMNGVGSEFENDFKRRSSTSSSTLSIHIIAYENSFKASTDSDGSEIKSLKKKGSSLIKKWKTAKHLLIGSKSNFQVSHLPQQSKNLSSLSTNLQYPFELPRQQQSNQISKPEMLQFKASQKLLNPSENFWNAKPLPKRNYTFDLDHWYLQYCLATGLYMLEPWERKLFNSFVLGCIAIGAFLIFPAISSLLF